MKMQIPLEPHDRVVASFPWRDWAVVVTERGKIIILECGYARGADEIRIKVLP